MQSPYLTALHQQIEPVREKILHHPLYGQIQSVENVHQFMSYHVYAVWDFMSLLKCLQQQLTCTTTPWFPQGSPNTRFLINEIVVGEESDVDSEGNRMSHFELYLKAMQQAGASTDTIKNFIATLQSEKSFAAAFEISHTPQAVRDFVNFTFEVIATGKPHIQAAVFTFGREDLIPQMFIAMVDKLNADADSGLAEFKYYLERHIEVDGDHHSHLALAMTAELCGEDASKWEEASAYVIRSLQHRVALWDGVAQALAN